MIRNVSDGSKATGNRETKAKERTKGKEVQKEK